MGRSVDAFTFSVCFINPCLHNDLLILLVKTHHNETFDVHEDFFGTGLLLLLGLVVRSGQKAPPFLLVIGVFFVGSIGMLLLIIGSFVFLVSSIGMSKDSFLD